MADHRYLSGNALVCGDCLDVMRELPDECVDLIYLDPPFNSNAFYVAAFGDKGLVNQQLRDVWRWNEASERAFRQLSGSSPLRECVEGVRLQAGRRSSMAAYILYMGTRLEEMHRVLKPTGSIYLHCDPHANAYLRVLLDVVFGLGNFRNEIVWFYRRWAAAGDKFQSMHDTILFYSKSKKPTFNTLFVETSASRAPMKRGYNTNTYISKGVRKRQIIVEDAKSFEDAVAQGEVDLSKYERVVHRKSAGTPAFDVFEVPIINPQSKERVGYPTQKPLALLERIIRASSNEGDLVLDPFCGCGTAADAAASLGRGYLGIDISGIAVRVMEQRLTTRGSHAAPEVYGLGWDDITWVRFEELAFRPREESADGMPGWAWAEDRVAGMLNAIPNERKTGDEGVDVRYFGVKDLEANEREIVVPIQVKAWRSDRRVGRPQGQSLLAAQMDMQREGRHAPMSMMVSLYPPAASLRAYAAAQGEVAIRTREEGLRAYPRMQALSVREMLEKDERPLLPPPDPRYLVGDTQTRLPT